MTPASKDGPDPGLDLFRSQAVAAYQDPYGRPVEQILGKAWLIVICLLLFVVAVGVGISVIPYSRVETVKGQVEAGSGTIDVSVARQGVIKSIAVREGQYVVKGQDVAVLAFGDGNLSNGASLARLLQKETRREGTALDEQSTAQVRSVDTQIAGLHAQIGSQSRQVAMLDGQIAIARQKLENSRATLATYERLNLDKTVSDVQVRDKQAETLDDEKSVLSLERDREVARSEIANATTQQSRLKAEGSHSLAEIDASRAALAQKSDQYAANDLIHVTAPISGYVSDIEGWAGKSISAGEAIVSIAPSRTALRLILWAPTKAVGFVRPGDKVKIMYDAFPYQKFGLGQGVVTNIASSPVVENAATGISNDKDAAFRVDVSIADPFVSAYGRRWALRSGMRLSADVVLERRTIGEWLIEPLLAPSGRL